MLDHRRKTSKLVVVDGSQSVTIPREWEFSASAEKVYLWRDETTGNILISVSPKQIRRHLFPQIVAELFAAYLLFALMSILIALAQRLLDFISNGETAFVYTVIHFVAYGSDFILFIGYHFLKLRELFSPELADPDSISNNEPSGSWISLANSMTASFFTTFANFVRRPKKAVIDNNIAQRIGRENVIPLVRMMQTALNDETIREVLRAKGCPEKWIDESLNR